MSTNQQRREAAKRKLERQQDRRKVRAEQRRKYSMIGAIVLVVLVVAAVMTFSLMSSGGSDEAQPAVDPAQSSAPPGPSSAAPTTDLKIPTQIAAPLRRPNQFPAAVNCAYPPDGSPPARPAQAPPATNISARGTVAVNMPTSAGPIELTLDRGLAPCTVNSFVSLARQGYFDATSCHRLTTDPGLQVLQCGDPAGTGGGGPGYSFADETYPQLSYGRGYLAMANAGPNTNGSQFFMIYGDASALSPDYTVFGYITPAGLGTVDKIARAGHDGSMDPSPGGGKPNMKVTIDKVSVG
ncbi:peptidylprolyl isomerase [Pseudonocardia eucalypti]|uniref:Peptidyl-prolyl cis-trans isomerase n=1 Tax=Pseudonocardia eucalypti TaxID=648755 RepID=A0ABP9QRZ0_9PSEU|nr:peptidyl-prolyl cis-trans isomerase B (cyclophilin B) [Pseudonocardia eucalypti]